MGSVRIDPFYYKQPPLSFVGELKRPVHEEKPDWFVRIHASEGEVCVSGAFILCDFPDDEKLLDTALEDYTLFLNVYGIAGDRYPIHITKGETECYEAYVIKIGTESCEILANDTEGVRRALVYLEDEMHRRSGPILPLDTIRRKPAIRHRITRGFFSPTNRPPKNIDELMDDVDYYPDEYLNRLAHDGTNGLWIYTYFSRLVPSDVFTEYGEDYEKRIAKLKRVVAKCKRYGVKVWIFGVEPFGMAPELAKKYSDAVAGVNWNGHYSICPNSEQGARYCVEVTQRLFEMVPDLAGIIDITYGERPSSCANDSEYQRCPRCRRYSRSQILARTIDLLKEGIRRSGANAEFVSWTYAHRLSEPEEIREYVRLAPEDVILQENFEDAGYAEQLGKTRQAVDYWLSYTGPSQMFENAAGTALKENKRMFAKMQVCCSHELATVPYIPVPGILFDKYAAARKYHVEGVMQCWYFGNYPSLMSKAAGELSFMEDFSNKEQFLEYLAGIYAGEQGPALARAWNHFSQGYANYPINIMFGYYGPMHDGVVWELALKPRDASLPRSWQLPDKPDGDRIGECLQNGHTLPEAVELTGRICREWDAGMALLPKNTPMEQQYIAQALSLLFASGNDILEFYRLREALAQDGNENLLASMEAIVDREILRSDTMSYLCEQDSRLGYHSEAEGFKFFPEKLQHRNEYLRELKKTEFTEIRDRLCQGKCAFSWYEGKTGPGLTMSQGLSGLKRAEFTPIADSGAEFRVAYDNQKLYLELKGPRGTAFRMHFEFRLLWPSSGVIIQNGEKSLTYWGSTLQGLWGEKISRELEKYQLLESSPEEARYLIAVDREKAGWEQERPLRMMLAANDQSWIYDDDPVHTLGKNEISPGEFGWLRPF